MGVWKTASAACLLGSLGPVAFAQAVAPEAPAEASRVSLTADNVYVLEEENLVVAEGNVQAEYEGRVMTADKLTYNRLTAKVRAQGNVVVLEPDGTQRFADEIETDADLANGYAANFAMRTPEGATASANLATRENETYNTLDRAIFTACALCEGDSTPTWAIRARKAVFNEESGMYSYRDAVLEVAGIPVIYLPYFAHPDPEAERRSGFLFPTVGSSSKRGIVYQQPYFWAISPYQDLTVSPMLNTKVNPLIELDYRKRFWSGQVNFNGSFTYEQNFDSDGEKFGEKEWRGHIFGNGKFQITDNWLWGFGVEKASDDLYTRRYDIDGENEQRGLYTNQPRLLLSQVFAQGQSSNWYADASLLTFDSLRFDDAREDAIADVLPLGYAERVFDLDKYGYASVNMSTAYLTRDAGADSLRTSVGSEWSVRKVLPGGILAEPFAEARFDHYQIDDFPAAGDSSSVERAFGTAGLEVSYPFFRPGKSVDITIEPIVMGAVGTSGANEDAIPIEDGNYFELDTSSLFEGNAQVGYDLYEGDSKISAGISTVARWKSGVEFSALAGKRWRNRNDPAFDEPSGLDGTSSDWVGAFALELGNPLSIQAKVRLDDETLEMNRIDTGLNLSLDRVKANALYYQIKQDVSQSGQRQEGVLLTSEVSVTDNYFLLYGLQRDIEGNRDIRHSLGVGYEDDCSRFELVFERSEQIDRQLGPSDSVLFRFALKSLGNVGSSNFD
ncbi:LPS-assembly protein LptD [Henriciella mobilis]|uniref:LPS-assembly protein LptD n=1 Tax=Henriciella mobilis TaxID=2305467 RepID=UPI000E676613|nr:LPS assembly protein LptD [Henriciella mobilis]RIJ15660.1 LPS-assembly protein LptD [Henriciella mobilis]RIJ19124.1 LPS-assembly protein LptD [Henriciella mobilis]